MKKFTPVLCPKASACNLYNDKILYGHSHENVYKLMYCTTCRYKECKRYQTYRQAGECPDFVMPNSKYQTDHILRKIEEESLTPGLAQTTH